MTVIPGRAARREPGIQTAVPLKCGFRVRRCAAPRNDELIILHPGIKRRSGRAGALRDPLALRNRLPVPNVCAAPHYPPHPTRPRTTRRPRKGVTIMTTITAYRLPAGAVVSDTSPTRPWRRSRRPGGMSVMGRLIDLACPGVR